MPARSWLSAPAAEDWGELALTTLYPYAQAMPLIRYRTGDCLYLDHSCPSGEPGLGFLGRAGECVFETDEDGNSLLLFAPSPLLNIVDRISDIALRPHMYEQIGLLAPGSIGRP